MHAAIEKELTMNTSRLNRKGIWALLIWTAVAAVIAYPLYLHNRHVCDSSLLGQEGCAAAGGGPTFWQPFVAVWFFGLVILGIVWLFIRPKNNPSTDSL